LLRQNFGNNRSYSRSGAADLMQECGIDNWRLVGFHQEFEPGSRSAQGLSWLLPATRLVYEIGFAPLGPALSGSAEHSNSTNSRLDSSNTPANETKISDA
jgi:hypothetical protein